MVYAIRVRQAGGRIISWDEPHFGAPDKLGRLLTMLAQDDNHEYSKILSGHINRKFRWMDDLGSFRGAPPAGYASVGPKYGKHLAERVGREEVTRKRTVNGVKTEVTVTLPTADDVRQAITDCATGTATTALGRRLGMTPDAIAKLVRNTFYSTGIYEIRRADGVTVAYKIAGKPLVTPTVQASAISALESRRKGDNVSSRSLRDGKDDLSGALRCGHCGQRAYRYYGGGKKRKDGSTGPRAKRYACESCHKSVSADNADRAVHDLMAARIEPWMTMIIVPGNDVAAQLDRVKLELRELAGRGLDEDTEDAERARLRGERKRLESMPIVPDRRVHGMARREDGSIVTEGQRWESLSMAERREWLTDGTITITVQAAPGRKGDVIVHLDHAETPDTTGPLNGEVLDLATGILIPAA
jgi:hypothetical protein